MKRLLLLSSICLVLIFSFPSMAESPLSTTDKEKIIDGQIKILKSPTAHLETRRISAGLLMDVDIPGAKSRLLKILRSPNNIQARLAIIEAIADRDEPDPVFISPLIEILFHGDKGKGLQESASVSLGRFRDKKLITTLAEIAGDSQRSIDKRIAAIKTLGRIRTKQSVASLLKLMEQSSKQGSGQKEILSASSESLQSLTHLNFGTRIESWKMWWSKIKDKTPVQWLETQIDLLTIENRKLTDSLNETERLLIESTHELFRLSAHTDSDRIRIIQGYLTSTLPAQKKSALAILKGMILQNQPIPDEVRPSLRELLGDPDPQIRIKCVRVLRGCHDRKAVPRILSQLKSEFDPAVKGELLLAIGQLGDAKLLGHLIKELRSPIDSVSIGSIQAIAKLFQSQKVGDSQRDKVVQALLKGYQSNKGSEFNRIRQELLHTMAIVGDRRFLPIFKQALSDKSPGLRLDAIRGLTSIGDEKVVEVLLNQLNDPEPGVRAKLASGISDLSDDPQVVEVLLSRMNPNVEKDKQVRKSTWEAILSMVKRWNLSEQIKWASQLADRSDTLSKEQVLDMVEMLNAQMTEDSLKWSVDQKLKSQVALGDILIKTKSPFEALQYYGQAISMAKQLSEEKAVILAKRILLKLLSEPPNSKVVSAFLNDIPNVLNQKQIGSVTGEYVKWSSEPANVKQAEKILKLLSVKVRKSLSASKPAATSKSQPAAK